MKFFPIILMFILLFAGCSGSGNEVSTNFEQAEIMLQDLHLSTKEVNAWIVEKGKSSRLNISGKLEIFPSRKYELEFLRLKEVQIFQNSKIYSRVNPVSRFEDRENDQKSRFLLFSTIKGVIASSELNQSKPIDLIIVFEEAGELLIHKINNISLSTDK